MGGSGYNFNISFFDEPEANLFDDPCTSSYGHHLICVNEFLENTIWEMDRLNSGIKNRHNFFLISIFLVQKVESDSVNLSDSGNI